ncbi:MAG: ferritin-like domain-containing protein [Thermomicrobiales bacterium]|jgi:hypothetical protein
METGDLPARSLFDRFQERISRREVVKGAGLTGLGVLAGYTGYLRTRAQQSPDVQNLLNVAITLETVAVTFFGVARQRGTRLGLTSDDVRFIRAAQCEEEAHYHFFEAAGGAPSTTAVSLPNAIFKNRSTFYQHVRDLEEMSVATYMAAANQFAQLGDPRLVEVSYQIGAIEAQHQVLVRAMLGDRLPNDRAFAQWMFSSVKEAGQALSDAGYVDGPGKKYEYPGPVDIFCRGVFGLVPETTEPAAPAASPSPEASPAATPSS